MKYDAGADAYDLLTGRWSRMFAQTAIGKARINPGDRVLDVATGTGDTAVLACSAVGASGYCFGLDVSVPMLCVAATKASTTPVGFLAASAMALPFPDGVFDAILCQFGLMFFPDRLQALAELRRVLRSNRRLVLTVWERPERAAFAGFLAEALSEQLPDLEQELLRPFSLSAPNEVRALLTAAGFNEVDVVRDARIAQFDSFEDYWKPYEQGGGRLGQAYLSLSPDAQATVRRQVFTRLDALSWTVALPYRWKRSWASVAHDPQRPMSAIGPDAQGYSTGSNRPVAACRALEKRTFADFSVKSGHPPTVAPLGGVVWSELACTCSNSGTGVPRVQLQCRRDLRPGHYGDEPIELGSRRNR